METEAYWDALEADPLLAQMIRIALEDGEIDLAAAVLAWWLIARESEECWHHPG